MLHRMPCCPVHICLQHLLSRETVLLHDWSAVQLHYGSAQQSVAQGKNQVYACETNESATLLSLELTTTPLCNKSAVLLFALLVVAIRILDIPKASITALKMIHYPFCYLKLLLILFAPQSASPSNIQFDSGD